MRSDRFSAELQLKDHDQGSHEASATTNPVLIDHNQTGFIRGRSISETFVYATGLVKVCHKRRLPALVLKLDFAKAFDTVNWDGLFRVLRVRGFSKTWVGWMLDILAQS
jgi:hypothetical protein